MPHHDLLRMVSQGYPSLEGTPSFGFYSGCRLLIYLILLPDSALKNACVATERLDDIRDRHGQSGA
jgi:hypothetical protein